MATETTFGIWLRQQRRQLDWTQAELAQRVDYSVATIRKLERDELRPSKQLAERLAQVLDVAVTQQSSLVSFARATPTASLQPDAQPIDEPRRSNLPAQLTPFFGRTAEIVELTQHLNNPSARLITIVGPGGMGKTRLAQEVAQSIYELRAQRAPANYEINAIRKFWTFVSLSRTMDGVKGRLCMFVIRGCPLGA